MRISAKKVLIVRLSAMLWSGGMLFGSMVYSQTRPDILFLLADDAGAFTGLNTRPTEKGSSNGCSGHGRRIFSPDGGMIPTRRRGDTLCA
jgi:hypothetical protein